MTDCTCPDMRDGLPDLIHGRLSPLDRATLTAHVEGCPACVEELGLLREIRATAPLAPSVDVGRIVEALPQPVAAGPRLFRQSGDAERTTSVAARMTMHQPRRFSSRSMWQIAAAFLVVAGGAAVALTRGEDTTVSASRGRAGAAQSHGAGSVTASASAPIPADDRGAAPSPGQGPAALAAVKPVVGSGPVRGSASVALTLVGGVNELSDAHIEQLLSEIEGMDHIPSLDPESGLSGLENLEEEG